MRIAVLGDGKTGSEVVRLSEDVTVFNTSHPVGIKELEETDVLIAFIPGEDFKSLLPLLLESRCHVISGCTGFSYPEDFHELVKERGKVWVQGNNFSLGMQVCKALLERISSLSQLFDTSNFEILETHHVEKRDQPSGTALLWKKWLNKSVSIQSFRETDVVGVHELKMQLTGEEISLTHSCQSREPYARGALLASKLISQQRVENGFYLFEEILQKHLYGGLNNE